ncbi:polyketide biosynthesis malonyl-ACP decarboxylase PksF [Corallococcus caeni]|uniref:beta-ketoacyl synthase N-terminal-like domain-containing protein n=1 Tax=Corallococcus caeni TaxID=3082388 RepID=UPI0029580167|nr:polyketide biosynthesis malonyl-ACP decarboxylase PksF [Corallococcus sp. KH5-1]
MSDRRIIITGMGALTAQGVGVPALARGLREGRVAIRAPLQPALAGLPAAAELDGFMLADALKSLPQAAGPLLEKARRLAQRAPRSIECATFSALEAWLDAGLHTAPVPAERVGLIVAGSNLSLRLQHDTAKKFAAGPEFIDPRYAMRFLDTDHVGVLSEVLGIRGEGFTVGGASASGNVALLKAWQLLQLGEVDACVVVGPLADLSPMELRALHHLGALSPGGGREADQVCRPFDAGRDGFVLGQGTACVVLEREDSALRRGAPMHAELAGASLVLSASHSAAPDVVGEAAAMRKALSRAGVAPEAVDYVNAHASASTAGDDAEVQALREVFGGHLGRVWLNATKGLLGHCLFSAGVVECIATVLQLRGGFLHRNANLREPLARDCRFCGDAATAQSIGVALSNSFGFGGINTSVVIRGS